MDLRPTASERAFRAELHEWLLATVTEIGPHPRGENWPERRAYECGFQRRLYDAGYAGITWPKEAGGRDATLGEQLIYFEELAITGAPLPEVLFVAILHGGPTLIAEGSPEQKARHLDPILRGDQTWCQGFSEPGAGSDLAALSTRAIRDGDHYVVSGQKIWTSFAQTADYAELLVRTDPDVPKHKGITWLVMPMDLPGIELRPIRTIDGEADFCEMFLDEVRIPVEHRVGDENDGWRVTNVTLRFERGTGHSAQIASLQADLVMMAAAARLVTRKGATAWDDAELRRDIGRCQAELDGLWGLVKMTVSEAAQTGIPGLGGSAIKLIYGELDQRIGDLALRIIGRAGLSRDDLAGVPAMRFSQTALHSRSSTIAAGTSQIQRNIIAERILGLPKDPR